MGLSRSAISTHRSEIKTKAFPVGGMRDHLMASKYARFYPLV